MKKILLPTLFLGLLIVSCGEKKAKENSSKSATTEIPTVAPNPENSETIVDSTTLVIENAQKEIEESSKNLDNLLNDLN
jgi:hypothetical protein